MERIELTNYRCFQDLTLTFKKRVNLLIGDNASGKTTLIRALRLVLSSFFNGFSDENTRFFGLSKDDFTIIKTDSGLANEKPIKINFRYSGVEASLELHSVKGRTLQKPLGNISKLANRLQEELFDDSKRQVKRLPLFASFSTTDIHRDRKLSMTPFTKYEHKPSFGYYECLQGDGFLPYWTKRLLILKEAARGNLELEGVREAINNALGPQGCNIISDMDIRHNQGKVYYIFTDKREVDTDNLSDGYRRLVNIVTDLAFRCMLLNMGIHGDKACIYTKGTVLIDEIDLHLHPSLQSKVLRGLRNAFPKLQFIVTTHAPMVMTGIELKDDSIIYKLNYTKEAGYIARQIELYGMDASTIIQVALGIVPRSKEVDDRLKTLFNFIDTDQYVEASEYLKKMKEEFGDKLPDLAKAEAMLDFLNVDDGQDR